MADEIKKMPETRPAREVLLQPETPESAPEAASEQPSEAREAPTAPEAAPISAPIQIEPNAPSAPPTKDPELAAIENILADGLEDLFRSMDPIAQAKFRAKGEEVAGKIKQMVDSTKIKIKKIVEWIRDWLGLIPGVSRYFLEQETKIRTDKILAHAEEKKERVE